jgi:HK97 family phage major capsid protein
MDLKHLKLPEGQTFDEKELNFLKALDASFDAALEGKADKAVEKTLRDELDAKMKDLAAEQKFDLVQQQLDKLFLKIDPMNRKAKPTGTEKEARQLTAKWVRAMIHRKGDIMKQVETELKEGGWVPGDGGLPVFDPGPVVMHGAHGFDPEQGSYLVPELLLAEVYRFVSEAGIARRDMRYLPFSGPGNERWIPMLLQSVVVGWVDHAGVKPKSKPYIGRVKQVLEKLAVIVPMTEEIVEDAAIDIVSFVGQLIGEAFAIEEDRVFLAGSIAGGDPFNGVINAAGTVPVPLGGAGLTPDFLNAAIYAIPTPARRGAKFYMNPADFATVQTFRVDVLAPGDGLGAYLVQQPTGEKPASIWNYPIVLTDELPASATVAGGDPFMFFGNLAATCVYGDKLGLRIKMLDQASIRIDDADPTAGNINLAEHDMIAIRAHKRVGYVPVLPQGIAVFTA